MPRARRAICGPPTIASRAPAGASRRSISCSRSTPRALLAHFELYRAIMFQASPLSRAAREALAVAVSEANGCSYCMAHHGEALRRVGDGGASLLPDEVLAWARRLARNPEAASETEIEILRAAGLEDRAILDAVLTVAYFSYVNRIVLALGARLDSPCRLRTRPRP
jgi:AhpD family alkylhydroperoxidase